MNHYAIPGLIRKTEEEKLDLLIEICTKDLGLKKEELVKSKRWDVILRKQFVCYLSKEIFKLNLTSKEMSKIFYNNDDHTNILYSVKTVKNRLAYEDDLKQMLKIFIKDYNSKIYA
jgi:chromosomal replication initiation ATPase DnaA